MKNLIRWTPVMMCVAVVLGAVTAGWAEQQKGTTSGAVFEKFDRALRTAEREHPAEKEREDMVKQRRIILNDDGDDPPQRPDQSIEDCLRVRFTTAVNTQVDSYFLCVACTSTVPPMDEVAPPNSPRIDQTMSYWFPDMRPHPRLDKLTRGYTDAAHEAGMEIFASLRMNDIHDAWAEKLTYPLKVQRPDLLIGEKQMYSRDEDTLMCAFWSGFDYAKEEVREHFRDFILSYCRIYDYDGVELDYFRHPLFFKLGEEEQNLDTMTDFMRQVRQGLNEIGRERGKPYLLAARVPDTPDAALRTGLDVEEWLRQGLLDLLIVGGGYMPYSGRIKELIDMAHHYGVPAYPCKNHFDSATEMRSIASNFWALGGDGFYMFNYYGCPEGSEKAASLKQMGDPQTLAGLDKVYKADTGCSIFYCGHTNPASPFPVRLAAGDPIELVVGDDVEKAAREGVLGRMLLRLQVRNLDFFPELSETNLKNDVLSDERIAIHINGARIPDKDIERADKDTFVALVTAPPLKRGINRIVVLPGPNSVGALSATVDAVELAVDYKPVAPEPAPSPSAPRPDLILSPVTPMPLSLFDVPVGTSRTLSFDLTADPKTVKKARLALSAEDFDEPAELTITFNGQPLPIPKSLLSGSSAVIGFVEIPANLLRAGKNDVAFTFVSNLNGTTTGFAVLRAFLVLWLD